MTYCLGIKLKDALVGISDTRITSGTETTTAKKVTLYQKDGQALFIMTSGLRSVRDKALTYFKEVLEVKGSSFNKMYKAVNAFGEQLKKVAEEDLKAIQRSGLHFNLHTIVGGQLEQDEEHKLYLIYPEGNWVEIGPGSPFVIIGNSGYGKPILNRTITHDSDIKQALKAGFLSFDSTRVSANDVDFPIDVVIYNEGTFKLVEHRYERSHVLDISTKWANALKNALEQLPEAWMDEVMGKLKGN